MAEKILSESEELEDGMRYELVAYEVPEDEHFKEGIKYSFQYLGPDGTNILRYDNARHSVEDIPRHHKHVGSDEEIQKVEYAGDLVSHKNRFLENLGLKK